MWAPRGNSLNSMLCAGATVTAIGDQFIHSILVWCCAFLVVFFFSSHFPSLLRLSFSHSLRSFHPHSYECYHSRCYTAEHTRRSMHTEYCMLCMHCIAYHLFQISFSSFGFAVQLALSWNSKSRNFYVVVSFVHTPTDNKNRHSFSQHNISPAKYHFVRFIQQTKVLSIWLIYFSNSCNRFRILRFKRFW